VDLIKVLKQNYFENIFKSLRNFKLGSIFSRPSASTEFFLGMMGCVFGLKVALFILSP